MEILTKLIETAQHNIFTVITIPLIAALIGWITNYIAVKMIFRPRRPINIFGFKLLGLIPRRQRELASSIGDVIQKDLISLDDVRSALHTKEVESSIATLIEQQVDNFLQNFISKNPMISMFLSGEMVAQVKESLVSQMQGIAPTFLETVMQHAENKLDFKKIVQQKIEGFDLSKLEDIIYRISAKELKTIELLGGVLGFIVGLLQVAIMLAGQL